MTEQNKILIKQFQETIIVPMQDILKNRQYKNWRNDALSVTLEEIICTIVVKPKSTGFTLTYCCDSDQVSASSNGSLDHMNHCLCELLRYLELYHSKEDGLLPIKYKLDLFEQGLKELLQIINPNEGKISKHFRVI